MTEIVRVTALPPGGFRRGGIHHPAEVVDHPADRFDAAALAVLKAEPNLKVELREAAPGPGTSAGEDGGNSSAPAGDAGGDGGGGGGEPDRSELIRRAIRGLDPANADHFTKGGKPDAGALSGLLGSPVTAAERDAAWSDIVAERAAAAGDGGAD